MKAAAAAAGTVAVAVAIAVTVIVALDPLEDSDGDTPLTLRSSSLDVLRHLNEILR